MNTNTINSGSAHLGSKPSEATNTGANKTPITVSELLAAYRAGKLTPKEVLTQRLSEARGDKNNCWIECISTEQLENFLGALKNKSVEELPLYGIPFAIKDNIDLAGLPTTAGCREYAYTPTDSAFVVQKLIAAGAVPIGKTNLDQFATGLVGTRSPWGAVNNSFNAQYISGGSSSGSAVSVATGQVCFSLGTDTAGSGRVPAAFNNIVGMKASKGLVSCTGVVPACRSLDCVTLFAHTTDDINNLLNIAGVYDANDCYARANNQHNTNKAYQPKGALTGTKIGVPKASQLTFFGNASAEQLFNAALDKLKSQNVELIEIDFQAFIDAALLLYQGPWVAERYAAIQDFFEADSSRCLPVIEAIVSGARGKTAVDAFKAMYKLQAFKVQCDAIMQTLNAVVIPTAGTIYTIDEVNADPIQLNSNIGHYTNFMNLLDYSAIALPAGMQSTGLPFGITLFGPAWSDRALLSMGAQWQQLLGLPLGATQTPLPALGQSLAKDSNLVEIAVCGAHLKDLPLNFQLTERNATLVKATQTAASYKLYALAGGPPYRPGLIRVEENGAAIEVEVWEMPVENLGSFLAGIRQPLGLGKVEIADGTWVTSFICEGYAVKGARDITEFGGWRGYLVG